MDDRDVRAKNPDVIFLSEAFTRPKVMYRLAKLGFSQSYTYFTWRNTKHELIEYLTELSSEPIIDFFRPNFFVNTPDINPYYLQTSGRPGFVIRAVLAATLSSLWGMYCGFELCESTPSPGREEYLDSEKYEIKVRDYGSPGNIIDEISRLNRIRKSYPELQSRTGLTFCSAHNCSWFTRPARAHSCSGDARSVPSPRGHLRVAVRTARACHRRHGGG
jgi:starch synthase (maltosyl-transferring)